MEDVDAIAADGAAAAAADGALNDSGVITSFNDSRCGYMDQHYNDVWNRMQWWCEGIIFAILGLIGLAGNLLSIAVLLANRESRRHSFNQLLVALATFDVLFIVVSIPVYSFTLFGWFEGNQIFSLLYVHFLYPMSPVTLCASVYMTLAVTIERYLAVCKPITYRHLNTTMSASRRVFLYVAPVAALSVVLNIPKFLETTTTTAGGGGGEDGLGGNGSAVDGLNDTDAGGGGETKTEIKVADMRLDPTYMLWFTISQMFHPTLTTGIVPMALLIYMNTKIYLGIRLTNAKREQRRANATVALTNSTRAGNSSVAVVTTLANGNGGDLQQDDVSQQQVPPRSRSNTGGTGANRCNGSSPAPSRSNQQQQHKSSERALAFALIGIVMMHLACHMLRVFLACLAVYLIGDTVHCMTHHGGYVPPLWSMLAECVSSILIMANFSGNFLIYCSALKPFQDFFRRSRLCRWWAGNGRGSGRGGSDRSREPNSEARAPLTTTSTTNLAAKSTVVVAAAGKAGRGGRGGGFGGGGGGGGGVASVSVHVDNNNEQQQQQMLQQTPSREERSRRLLACPQERARVSVIIAAESC